MKIYKKIYFFGNSLILNTLLKNSLIFSMYIENKIPNSIPNPVASEPITKPTIKKFLISICFELLLILK